MKLCLNCADYGIAVILCSESTVIGFRTSWPRVRDLSLMYINRFPHQRAQVVDMIDWDHKKHYQVLEVVY
jgi:hypothetical protein